MTITSATRAPHLAPADPPAPLILDFLESLRTGPQPYAEVMEAWRTSCPRLSIWEDAVDQGLVQRLAGAGGATVALTELGRGLIERLR